MLVSSHNPNREPESVRPGKVLTNFWRNLKAECIRRFTNRLDPQPAPLRFPPTAVSWVDFRLRSDPRCRNICFRDQDGSLYPLRTPLQKLMELPKPWEPGNDWEFVREEPLPVGRSQPDASDQPTEAKP
jgi:hypothetical protein